MDFSTRSSSHGATSYMKLISYKRKYGEKNVPYTPAGIEMNDLLERFKPIQKLLDLHISEVGKYLFA